MSPEDLPSKGFDTQIHVSVNSRFFGFIDDMYMQVKQESSTYNTIVVEMQSQLRMGKYDFMQNYHHVKTILDCLNNVNEYKKDPPPCSE